MPRRTERAPRHARHDACRPDDASTALGLTRGKRKKLASLLRSKSDEAGQHNLQGVLLTEKGNLEEAIEAFDRAVQHAPDNADFQINLGGALLKAGRVADAIAPLEAAVALRADSRPARLGLAEALVRRGDYDAAAEHAGILAAQHPGDRVVRHLQAAIQIERRDFETAARMLDSIVSEDLEDADAWHNLGTALLGKDAFADAARCYQSALILRPDHGASLMQLAQAYLGLDRPDDAGQAFLQAVKTTTDPETTHNRMIQILDKTGRHELGVQVYHALLQDNPEDPEALNFLAALLMRAGKEADALECLEVSMAKRPYNARPYFMLGNMFYSRGDLAKAADFLSEAAKRSPVLPEALFSLGLCKREPGQLDEALDAFQRYAEHVPGCASGRINIAFTLTELGRTTEALDAFVRVLEIEPERESAKMHILYHKRALYDWSDKHVPYSEIALLGWAISWPPRFRPCSSKTTPSGNSRGRKPGHGRPTERRRRRSSTSSPAATRSRSAISARTSSTSRDAPDDRHAAIALPRHVRSVGLRLRQRAERRYEPPIVDAVDHYYDINAMTPAQVAGACREIGLDIALHRNGYTKAHRTAIFAERAAPVQGNYLGYPSTLGAPFMDYIVADHVVIPPEWRHRYSENVIYMPHSYQPNDGSRVAPEIVGTRANHGLPEDAVVLCCFNNGFKIDSAAFDIWMRVMRNHPRTCLWLLASGKRADANLGREAAARRRCSSAMRSAARVGDQLRVGQGHHCARDGRANRRILRATGPAAFGVRPDNQTDPPCVVGLRSQFRTPHLPSENAPPRSGSAVFVFRRDMR